MADMLRDDKGRPVSGILFSVMFSYPPLSERVRRWQAVQHRDGSVTVSLVANEAFTSYDLERVRGNVEGRLGAVKVEVNLVDWIPPAENGKHRTVIVER